MSAFGLRLVTDAVAEFEDFLGPLLGVGARQETLFRFLTTLGWDLEPVLTTRGVRLVTELQGLYGDIAGLALALRADEESAAVADAHTRARAALDRLDRLYPILQGLGPGDVPDAQTQAHAEALAGDVAEHLAVLYVARRAPVAYQLGLLAGVLTRRRPPPLHLGGDRDAPLVRYPVERVEIDWDALTSPHRNPLLAVASLVDLSRVDSFETFLAQLDAALTRPLRAVREALGERGLDGMSVHLDTTGLAVTGGGWLPFPDPASGPIVLPLPQQNALSLTIDPTSWRISWVPTDVAGDDLVLLRHRWVEIVLPAAPVGPPSASPLDRPGLHLSEPAGALTLTAVGGLGVRFPLDVLSGADGSEVRVAASARLTLTSGAGVRLRLQRIAISGDFRLGGADGPLVRDARIEARDAEWPAVAPGPLPFDLALDGELVLPSGTRVGVLARFDEADLRLESTATVHLGNGVWLLPDGDRPVLALAHSSAGRLEFGVSGLFRLPAGTGDGLRSVRVAGTLALARQDGAWVVSACSVGLAEQGLTLDLPGDLTLTGSRFAVVHEDGAFRALLGGDVRAGDGTLSLDASLAFPDPDEPREVRFEAEARVEALRLTGAVHLLDVRARVTVETRVVDGRVVATGALDVEDATAGLLPGPGPLPERPVADDFRLAVDRVAGRCRVGPAVFALTISRGSLRLPPEFGAEAPIPVRPAVEITSSVPLTLTVESGAVAFAGEFTFRDLTVRFGEAPGAARASLTTATLRWSNAALPALHGVAGTLTLPSGGGPPVTVEVHDAAWGLDGVPTGALALQDDVTLLTLGGVDLVLVGAAGTTAGTALTVTGSGAAAVFTFDGTVRVTVSPALLSAEDGSHLVLEAGGRCVVSTSSPVPVVTATHLAVGGTFRLGGTGGLLVRDAELVAEGLQHVGDPSPERPFVLHLSGRLTLPDGPTGGLENARLVFEGGDRPRFDLDGIVAGTGELAVAGGFVPLSVTELRLAFDPAVPLPDKLHPRHITATVDAEVDLHGVVTGSVRDLVLRVDDQGVLRPSVDTLVLQVTGLELTEGFAVSGSLALGGLTQIPDALVLAGRLGGKLNGTGVSVLAAFGVVDGAVRPLGAALEASLGPAGIPLGPTGFLLTGAAGGVSFTGSNADPDDLRAYVTVDESGAVTSTPRPPVRDDPAPMSQERLAPATAPPTGEPLQFQCPQGPCPPPSLGILYQPHPDRAQYPKRAIVKFTALDRPTVDRLLDVAGISRAALERMTPDDVATRVTASLLDGLAGLFPFSAEHLDQLRGPLARELTAATSAALGGSGSVYEALVAAAYKGVPAFHATVKLTGTFSYAGVSAFLSITGGFVLSPLNQSAGIVGSLDLVGIPVGTFRGFLSGTDEQGRLDPVLCGDLELSIGPLELGSVRMTLRAGIDAAGLSAEVVRSSAVLADDLLADVLAVVDPALLARHAGDPRTALAELDPAGVLGCLALLAQQPPRGDLQGFLLALFDAVWAHLDPEFLLCGVAQPKLFGLPLDGELVAVSANVTKDRFAAAFRFSPYALLVRLFGAVAPAMDRVSCGLFLPLPDPRPLVQAGVGVAPDTAERLLEVSLDGLRHVLRSAVATVGYDLAPMGFRLLGTEARLILPDLEAHPSAPGRSWSPPEHRGSGAPSRRTVLLAAVTAERLGDVFWQGTSAELRALPGLDPAAVGDLTLREDYFPHGGLLAAGRLALPRLFLDVPPAAELQQLLDGDTPARLAAARSLLDGLTTAEPVGLLAFYLPAPDPPAHVWASAPTPLDLVREMQHRVLDLDGHEFEQLYPTSAAFFSGSLGAEDRPVRLLGVPLGSAELDADAPDGQGARLVVRAGIAAGSWLRDVVGQTALRFEIRGAPPEPVAAVFGRLSDELVAGPADPSAVLDRLAATLHTHLPKVSLVAEVQRLQIPEPLRDLLGLSLEGSAELHAYSLAHGGAGDPHDLLSALQQRGGLAVRVTDVAFALAGRVHGRAEEATFTLAAPVAGELQPRVGVTLRVGELALPGMTVARASLTATTVPLSARIDGELAVWELGGFRVEPLPGRDSVPVRVDAGGRLSLGPARLSVPVLGTTSIRIHGATADDPFTFDPDGPWSARVSITDARPANPLDPDGPPLFTLPGAVTAGLQGHGLEQAGLMLDVHGGSELALVHGVRLTGRATGRLVLRSDGHLSYTGEHVLALPHFSAAGRLEITHTPGFLRRLPVTTATLTSDAVRMGPLPSFAGTIALSPGAVTAAVDLGSAWTGVPGSLEVRAGRWQLSYRPGEQSVTLTARDGAAARLLGRDVPALTSLVLVVESASRLRATATAQGWLPLLPGLLELQPARLHLAAGGQEPTVEVDAGIRCLRRGDGQWQVTGTHRVVLGSGAFDAVLLDAGALGFLPVSGPVHRRTGGPDPTRLVLRRAADDSLTVALRDLGVSVAGTHRVSVVIDTAGRAEVAVSGGTTSNNLSWTPQAPIELALELTEAVPSVTATLPPGRVVAGFPGWPANLVLPPSPVTVRLPPTVTATHVPPTAGWQGLAASVAEFRVTTPQLVCTMTGNLLSARLKGGVEVRSTLRGPGGAPLLQASAGLDAALDASGSLRLPLPPWPQVDPLQPARAACEQAARARHLLPDFPVEPQKPARPGDRATWLDWRAYDIALAAYETAMLLYRPLKQSYDQAVSGLQHALQQCREQHPVVPPLPTELTVRLADVIR